MPLDHDILAALQAIDTQRGPEPRRDWFAHHGPAKKAAFAVWCHRADAANGWHPTPLLGTPMQRRRAVRRLIAAGLVETSGNGGGESSGSPPLELQTSMRLDALLRSESVPTQGILSSQCRLQLHVLAYNLGNYLRRLALPGKIKHRSLTTMRGELIKTGARMVRHARYVTIQMAESPCRAASTGRCSGGSRRSRPSRSGQG